MSRSCPAVHESNIEKSGTLVVHRSEMAAAGDPDINEKLKKGHKAAGKTFKNHLDGFNFLPYLTGKEEVGPRKEFFYFNDDAQLTGVRYNRWKLVFMKQDAETQFPPV